MPSTNSEAQGRSWPAYVAIGGLGCAILGVIAWLSFSFLSISPHRSHEIDPSSYSLLHPNTACCITLPDGSGTLLYRQQKGMIRSTSKDDEERVIFSYRKSRATYWISPYQRSKGDVDFYWYPEKNGRGPYVMITDPALFEGKGEMFVIDLSQNVSRQLLWTGGKRLIAADYSRMKMAFGMPTSDGRWTTCNGKPVDDVTDIFGSNHGTYMGSVNFVGEQLRFVKLREVVH